MTRSDEEVGRVLRDARPRGDADDSRRKGLARIMSGLAGRSMPSKVGRFVLEERIGDRDAEPMFRAYDPELQRTLVVQLIGADAEHRAALLERAQRLAALEHPGVIAVYDVGQTGDDVYVAMEHVAGVTLKTWLRARADASWRDVVGLFVQAARGLVALRSAGISHIRFDPAEVLVGDDGRVRIRGLVGPRHGDADPSVPDGALSFVYVLDDELRRLETAGAMRLPRVLRQLVRPLVRASSAETIDLGRLADELQAALDPGKDDRERGLLIERVHRFWLEGVLAESLGTIEPVPLWIQRRPEALAGRLVFGQDAESTEERIALPDHASTEDLGEILDELAGRILVLGAAGSGKTIALLRLAQHLVDGARSDPTQPAPVVLNLASWSNDGAPLAAWIEDEVLTKYSLPRRATRGWIERGEIAMLLDGLDEVAAPRREACIEAINALANTTSAPIVVVSREDEYLACRNRLYFDLAVSLEPLDDVAVDGMIEELGESAAGLKDAVHADPELLEHARSPLVLGMLAVTGAEAGGDPEKFRDALYARYVDSVFRRRASRAPYPPEDVVAGLQWLARAMKRTGLAEIWLETLQRDLFERRSQRVLALGLGFGLLIAVVAALNTLVVLPRESLAYSLRSGITVALVTLPLCLAFIGTTRVVPVDALTWSWAETKRRAPATFAWGLLASGAYGAVFSTSIAVVMAIPTLVLLAGLRGLGTRDEASGVRPNQGIRQSALNALGLGVMVSAVTALVFAGLVYPMLIYLYPPQTLIDINVIPGFSLYAGAGLAFGSVAAMTYGGVAVAQHVGIRLVMAGTTPLPLRLRPFLDYAVERTLLRRVGGGYIFIHRALLDHFGR